jgi:hypothetical protein
LDIQHFAFSNLHSALCNLHLHSGFHTSLTGPYIESPTAADAHLDIPADAGGGSLAVL